MPMFATASLVVAIIGALAAIAVFAYRKVTSSAKVETEVNAIFAELRVRQEEYHAEHGKYLSTGAGESVTFPPGAPVSPANAPINISPLLAAVDRTGGTPADAWVSLRMKPRMSELRCVYVSIADQANSGAIGARAAGDFGLTTVPDTNWYYLLAECDTDGDSAVNSFYFARFDNEAVAVKDKGR